MQSHDRVTTTVPSSLTSATVWTFPSQFRQQKIVYRRYAGLFFTMCIDMDDNELAYLEAIHLFVEILDHYFSNVCELDIIFNFHKVRTFPLSWCLLGSLPLLFAERC